VELLDQAGRPLGMKDVRNTATYVGDHGKPVTQTLTPGTGGDPARQIASAAHIQFDTRKPGDTASYPRAAKVQVIPPDETQPLVAPITILYPTDRANSGATMVTSTTLTVDPMDGPGLPNCDRTCTP
jgi:hypothetical protein